MNILLIILWVLSGWAGFIYWWTKEFPFTTEEIIVMLLQSAAGPLAWVFGWLLMGNTSDKIIFNKRSK